MLNLSDVKLSFFKGKEWMQNVMGTLHPGSRLEKCLA